MTRTEYYSRLKALAREVRAIYGLTTPKVTLTDMRRIYKAYGIAIKLWPHRLKNLRGAYFKDENGPHVMIDKSLPAEQRIFTMAHELKHHLTDEIDAQRSDPPDDKEPKEIGAEIFAAELIFPEQDFVEELSRRGIDPGKCTADDIVRLKRETGTTLSHGSLAKRSEFLKYAAPGTFVKVQWRRLEEQVYGEPLYKQIRRNQRR